MADVQDGAPDQQLLLELYKLHTQEVWSQVQLNWDRAKSSLTFHVALLAIVAGLGSAARLEAWLSSVLFAFIFVSALLCAKMLNISHDHYRRARDQRAEIEKLLHISLRFVTTRGMRGEGRTGFALRWPKVNNVILLLHLMIAAMAAIGAVSHWKS